MRNMSFIMTKRQMYDQTKDVTRRQGWEFLRPGEQLCAIERGQGLKKGETVVRIGTILVLDVRRERVDAIDQSDCVREGFPELTPAVAKREGLQLLALLSQLIDLHAAQIAPLAILEELNRAHADDADRDQRIGAVLQQPHADYRQAQWAQDVQAFTAQLASGPIRRQTDQWALITLAAQISDAALVTQARLVELTERLRGRGVDVERWLSVI